MKIKTPDHYRGKPIPEDAIEIALAAEKKKKDSGRENEEKETQGKAQGEAPSLDDFIYVPSIKLYFAKERTLGNHNWHDTHRELHKQNLRMPTIPQFVEFLKYLRADPTAENTRVYNKITEIRDPQRAEWFDAEFYKKDGELWVAYNHIVYSNGNVVVQENEKLEGHLMQDNTPGISLEQWLNNPTKQGLPQEDCKPGNLWYWSPKKYSVARLYTSRHGTGLSCSTDPGYADSGLGVFACAKNAGEKQ